MASAAGQKQSAVLSLFSELAESGGIHLVAIVPDGTTEGRWFGQDIEDAWNWARARNDERKNIYWTVNCVDAGVNKKPSKTQIRMARFVHVDIDPPENELILDREKVLDELRNLPCPPSFVVDSGNGLQPLWRLAEPTVHWSEVEDINIALRDRFNADNCQNIDRLLRVPGTVNWPNKKKAAQGRVSVLSGMAVPDDGVAYTVEELTQVYPKAEPTLESPQKAKEANSGPVAVELPDNVASLPVASLTTLQRLGIEDLIDNPPGMDRSSDMMAVAGELVRRGVKDDVIAGVLTNPRHKVSAHALDQADPMRAVQRAILQAKRDWKSDAGDIIPVEEISTTVPAPNPPKDDTFPFMRVSKIKKIPPADFLVDGLLPKKGFSILYGEPGTGKSFVALDMALRLAHSTHWHGRDTKPTGVLYIAGEGVAGMSQRIIGWERKHGISLDNDRFALVPMAVQVMLQEDLDKLLRTIDAVKQELDAEIGLVVVDTVSRSIAGQDENQQGAMSAFVSACDIIAQHTGGAVLGVHHTNKQGAMRGSTVFPGACEAIIRLDRTQKAEADVPSAIKLSVEKMKDADEGSPIHMEMDRVEWQVGFMSKPASTLVPRLLESEDGFKEGVTKDAVHAAFEEMEAAWQRGKPYSHTSQADRDRQAARVFSAIYGGDANEWKSLIKSWLKNECLVFDVYDSHSKAKGLRVEKLPWT